MSGHGAGQAARPGSEAELAEFVAAAQEPLRVFGGGTRQSGAPVNGAPLSVAGISGIRLYEPGALTLVAAAGTPIEEVDAALAAEGQRLAFEPMDHRGLMGTLGVPTIGGAIAANASGPRRIQCGAARDFALGVRFVDGTGQIVANGGRVMKNVTGYDLVKLMAGSYGTLGILTEISLKVLPGARATGVLLREGLGDAEAIRALSMALGSPLDVSGAAHLQKGIDGDPVTMIRIEGTEASVQERCAKLCGLLAEFGAFAIERDPDRTQKGWIHVRDVASFHDRDGDVWRLSATPAETPRIVAQISGAEAVYDWGGALAWILAPEGTPAAQVHAAIGGMRAAATLVRGNRAAGAFAPLPAPVAALNEGLRRKFDPRGILNPGLMRAAA